MPRIVTKVHIDGESCTVEFYEREKDVRTESKTHDSQGVYHPDLHRSLQALSGMAIGHHALPKGWLDDGEELKCVGVSIQRDDKDEIKSFVVKLYHRAEDAQCGLNVACKLMIGEVTETGQELVRSVINEAIGFVKGEKRQQAELDLGPGGRKAA